jgi:hypothetical protein
VKQKFGFLALLLFVGVLPGCRENADSFFAGRPSGMATAHNRVLDGTLESMIELLRIPQRFSDASDSQKMSWQESLDSWWNTANGRNRILTALPYLTKEEILNLEAWVSARSSSLRQKTSVTLDEIAAEISAYEKRKPHAFK